MTLLIWLNKDGKLLLLANITRMLAFGFLSIILAIYLTSVGYDELYTGIIITATLVSGTFFTLFASLFADRIGRKKTLVLFSGLMSISGTIFAFTTDFYLLMLAALIGFINPTGINFGAFISVEQAIIPQTSSDRKRNYAFALFSTVGTIAVASGTLIAKVPEFLRVTYGLDLVNSYQPLFVLYALIGLVTMGIYAALTKNAEVSTIKPVKKVILSAQSKSIVKKLSFLFGIDSFAGGFVIQSWMAYWFFIKFAVPENEIADIFFVTGILTALSYILAVKMASKIGLVKTMVCTHIPANLLLIPLALAPSLQIAIVFYMVRMFLAMMDVPTRQSYVIAIVKPEERIKVAGLTNLSRNIPFSTSPILVGYMFQFVSLAFPFILSGVLKTVYDLLLYRSFKKIKPPEEQE